MSLTATTRLNRLPEQTDEDTAKRSRPPSATDSALIRPPTRAVSEQRILAVEFLSPDGRRWKAIGGGDTVAEAITFARQSCPCDTTWLPLTWDNLYGD